MTITRKMCVLFECCMVAKMELNLQLAVDRQMVLERLQ